VKRLNYLAVCVAVAAIFPSAALAQDFSSLALALPHVFIVIKKTCGESPSFSADAVLELTETGSTNAMMVMPSKFTKNQIDCFSQI